MISTQVKILDIEIIYFTHEHATLLADSVDSFIFTVFLRHIYHMNRISADHIQNELNYYCVNRKLTEQKCDEFYEQNKKMKTRIILQLIQLRTHF